MTPPKKKKPEAAPKSGAASQPTANKPAGQPSRQGAATPSAKPASAAGPKSAQPLTAPAEAVSAAVTLSPNERDAVYEAVYLESRERGMTTRDARSTAEDVCDRLRYTDRDDDHQGFYGVAGLIDLRSKQDYVYPNGKKKTRMRSRGVPVMRKPGDVDSIVIHQTACEFGVSRRAVRLHGDIETARAHRALDVACHAMAFRNGYFVAAHDLRAYVNHANRLNSRSLGLEIEGRYPGLMDDPSTMAREDLKTTWGGKPTKLTDQTVETACAALLWLATEGAEYGMKIKYVFAHRQSSDDRRSDPGQEIWQRVVLEFATMELGLQTVPINTWSVGRSIPKQWDPSGQGKY